VTLSVRPEAWRLEERAQATNCVRGRIGEAIYLGEVAQYHFAAEAGTLRIYELNPRVERGGGEDGFAWAAADDVVVLER
jgi:iron(III) transport system ATP-binding protein